MPAAPLLRFTCANALYRISRSTTASIDGPATGGRSRLVLAARASFSCAPVLEAPPSLNAQVQFGQIFCRMPPAETGLH